MSNVAQKIFEKNNINVDVKTGLSEEEIIKIIPEYDGMVVRSATKVTKNIIDAAKNLKVIGRAGAGVDNIDVPKAKEKNMIVMNTPGGNANATAEHAFALIMSVLRKTPFANETTHKGQWEKKNIKGTELSKKTLGIVGFGNVGVRLSHLVKGFDMKILVNSKSLESRKSEYPHVENVSFDDLITKSTKSRKNTAIPDISKYISSEMLLSIHVSTLDTNSTVSVVDIDCIIDVTNADLYS